MMSDDLKFCGGASSNVGEHKLPHLVKLGLTDLSKYRGVAPPPVPTSLAERTT